MFRITLLTAPHCDLCKHAKAVLAKVGQDHQLEVEELSIDTEEGTRLIRDYRIAFPPGIFIEGSPFSYGRLSERKLRAELSQLTVGLDESHVISHGKTDGR